MSLDGLKTLTNENKGSASSPIETSFRKRCFQYYWWIKTCNLMWDLNLCPLQAQNNTHLMLVINCFLVLYVMYVVKRECNLSSKDFTPSILYSHFCISFIARGLFAMFILCLENINIRDNRAD